MPAIAKIGTEIRVTPEDELQIVLGPKNHEFVDDRSPFSLRVSGTMEEAGKIVGVFGHVTSGHQRYRGQIATLLVRLDNSDWRRDNRSAANFKVGRSAAHLNGKYPFYHPDGSDVDGFPFVVRYGSVDSRSADEPEVNSALEAFHKGRAEQSAPPNGGPAEPSGDPGADGGPPSVS
jgi:hypothetical protein